MYRFFFYELSVILTHAGEATVLRSYFTEMTSIHKNQKEHTWNNHSSISESVLPVFQIVLSLSAPIDIRNSKSANVIVVVMSSIITISGNSSSSSSSSSSSTSSSGNSSRVSVV